MNKESINTILPYPKSCGSFGCEECYGTSSAECKSLQRKLAKWAKTQLSIVGTSSASYEETYDINENCPYCLDATAKTLFIDLQQARNQIVALLKEIK
jgi:hypothetical protein